jgi:DNA polymerase-1
MPILNCDVKGLEVVCVADLSRDPVLSKEIRDKEDIHENNKNAFNLPSRLIAKVFKFRLIYGGSAYSYAHDIDFKGVSTKEDFWQEVIDNYYNKYKGIAAWHKKIIEEVQQNGRLTIPSGRYFPFQPEQTHRGLKWPITQIKNFPCQGFGADLVVLARLEAAKRLREAKMRTLLIGTVHDSLEADAPFEEVKEAGLILLQSVEAVPKLCKQIWNYDFSLPLTAECSYGANKHDLMDLNVVDGKIESYKLDDKGKKVSLGFYESAKEAYKMFLENA